LKAVCLTDTQEVVCCFAGRIPEYTIVYAIRVKQVDSNTIELQQVFWSSLLKGFPVPAALQALEQPFPPFIDRVNKHLAGHSYAPETGHECDSDLEEGGFGVMGDVETLLRVMNAPEE
jgi:hypothetical protein